MNQNIPEPFENLTVPFGMKKLALQTVSEQPNSGVFMLRSEDHTIGNLIKCMLCNDDHVLFAGYRIIHPMKRDMSLRIQTDGAKINSLLSESCISWTPNRALWHALSRLVDEFE